MASRKVLTISALIGAALVFYPSISPAATSAKTRAKSRASASGERPPEPPGGFNGEQPPEPPEGFNGERPPEPPGGFNGEQPPEPPGGFNGGQPPEPPGGFNGERPPEPPGGFGQRQRRGGPQGGHGGGGMRDDPSDPSRYSGIETVSSGVKRYANHTFTSTKANYSPLYAKDGGAAIVTDSKFSSTVDNANAVLAIGNGSRVSISNAVITTTADSSRGLYAFQGGEITACNVKISTKGAHCAAMATDRGGGKVTVVGGALNTAGDGSPCIYATGELAARDVVGEATGSEAMVIEGRNSIKLSHAKLTAHRKCGAMIYQSFSGDAESGVGRLTLADSTITAKTGPMFFVTNTRAEIELERCKLVNNGKGPLVKIGPARWGNSGSNGGTLVLTARNQALKGDIEVSAISEFKMILEAGASYKGAVNRSGKGKKVEIVVKKGAELSLAQGSVAQVTREND